MLAYALSRVALLLMTIDFSVHFSSHHLSLALSLTLAFIRTVLCVQCLVA